MNNGFFINTKTPLSDSIAGFCYNKGEICNLYLQKNYSLNAPKTVNQLLFATSSVHDLLLEAKIRRIFVTNDCKIFDPLQLASLLMEIPIYVLPVKNEKHFSTGVHYNPFKRSLNSVDAWRNAEKVQRLNFSCATKSIEISKSKQSTDIFTKNWFLRYEYINIDTKTINYNRYWLDCMIPNQQKKISEREYVAARKLKEFFRLESASTWIEFEKLLKE